ncbi:MAG: protein kinase [Verrucomicrobiia bacterium]
MSDTNCCAECGAPLPPYWPKGLCAQCAVDRALVPTDVAADVLPSKMLVSTPAEPKPPLSRTGFASLGSFGEYDLLEEIARGGMGVVFKARQRNLGRLVAVKMILAGTLAGKEFVQRFRTEASAAAILQHPNIVAIHDVGVHEGRHYFSMDYVEGRNLAQLVGHQPLPPATAARYVETIAAAIHHAHERGILHRDLKPSNVLIDANDQARITDFGLARRLDGDSSLTVTGQVLGSPNFMPPEQACAKRGKVGRPSDVYAIGGILYYLLTARAPFQADSLEHLITQVVHAEPVSPRLLNPSISRDLETITLKCLEKEPSRRYQTAQELAEELGRVLHQEPIRARPLTQPEKVWRWCRRKPVLALLLVLLHVVGVAGLSGIVWQWRRAERLAESERQERIAGQRQLYVATMNLAQAAWEQNDLTRMRELLDETATDPERGFEWTFWRRHLHLEAQALRAHTEPVLAVAYSPNGQRIVTGSADKTAKVWDAATGKVLLPLRHDGPVRSVAFSSDGRRILTGGWDRKAKLWDSASGEQLRTFDGHTHQILSVAFSPDGQRIVTGSRDQTAKVWDAESGILLRTLEGHGGVVWSVAFSPDGERVVTGHWDRTARVWAVADGRELVRFKGHSDAVFSVAFSPDGKRIASGSLDQTASVWDSATGHELFTLWGHSSTVASVTFSSDGKRIATAGDDQTARVWDAVGRHERLAVKKHGSPISSVAFSPDGQHIITGGGSLVFSPDGVEQIHPGSGDRTVKVWELTNDKEPLTLMGHTDRVFTAAFSPDGQRVVTGSLDQTARIWDAITGRELEILRGHTSAIRSVAFSPNGQRIVTASLDRTAKVWDVTSGQSMVTFGQHSNLVVAAAFSADGGQIVTGGRDGSAKVWNPASGEELFSLKARHWIWSVAFSPDGRKILTGNGTADHDATVWDARSQVPILHLKRHALGVISAAFSPDGRQIATASADKLAKLWDAETGACLLTLSGHSDQVMSVSYSPDGKRILTGSRDQTARLWDVASGRELLTLKGHRGWVFTAAFSRDGQRIVTASGDGTAKIWEAAWPSRP